MSKVWMLILTATVLTLYAARASAAAPTRLTLTAPTSVGMGEDIVIKARLTTSDGQPVSAAPLTLFQVGAVGQRPMAQEPTDAKGVASFLHHEYTVAHLLLRVAFAGDARLGPSQAEADLEINGIQVPPAVVMSHTPGPFVKTVLFPVLGTVWLTYAFAGSCILRILRDGRGPKGRGLVRTGR